MARIFAGLTVRKTEMDKLLDAIVASGKSVKKF